MGVAPFGGPQRREGGGGPFLSASGWVEQVPF